MVSSNNKKIKKLGIAVDFDVRTERSFSYWYLPFHIWTSFPFLTEISEHHFLF